VQKYEFYVLLPYIFNKKCLVTKKMPIFAVQYSVKRNMKKVTILIPCFNEEASLPALYEALKELMDTHGSYAWEVLMVNDGSRDNTIDVIRQLRQRDERICYVDLSRNFGKENAMLAGFDYATGDCMVIMDADLQHPPHVIPEMLKLWEEGYEDVYAKRITRGKESWLRKRMTLLYYHLLQKTTRVEILENVGDFRLLDRKCIDALKQLRETQRYTKGMYCWVGFKKHEVLFEQGDRVAGESSFNFSRLLGLAMDGITSFTTAPLRLATVLGLVVSLVAFSFMCYVLVTTLIWGDPVQGYPTLMTVVLFLGGVQLLSLGIIGEYLGRIFHETKNRPVYIARETAGV
jgi:glycosyltransferase involved in cell wall biosynthesis